MNLDKWMDFVNSIGFAVLGIYLFFGHSSLWGLIGAVACMAIAKVLYGKFSRGVYIEQSEKFTQQCLLQLPKKYSVHTNIKLGSATLPFVVVGPNGVFVIVDRNVKGTIVCNPESTSWTVHKTGQKGGEYSTTIANPFKVLGWNIHVLSEHLKENSCKVWIEEVSPHPRDFSHE